MHLLQACMLAAIEPPCLGVGVGLGVGLAVTLALTLTLTLTQAFMFAAMEPPEDMSAAAIGRAKVDLLQCVRAPDAARGEVFLGQFSAGRGERGYLDDDTVPEPDPEPDPEPSTEPEPEPEPEP